VSRNLWSSAKSKDNVSRDGPAVGSGVTGKGRTTILKNTETFDYCYISRIQSFI
jgi:hypothetical protein